MGYRVYNSGIKSVCYECENRHPGCHDSCPTYIEARAEYDKKKEAIQKAKANDELYDDYKIKCIRKAKSKGRSHGKEYGNFDHKR